MVLRKNKPQTTTTTTEIHCTSQQSRFHTETLDSSKEIDLKDVTISIGERELLTNAHLRLKDGVKYGLSGRNGTGKSTLLKAIADKLIPGINPSIRILLLSQVEDSTRASLDESLTVLEHCVRGDSERYKLVLRQQALTKAVETTSSLETERIVRILELEDRQYELVQAQLIAKRRSGARGKAAREAEIKAEEKVKEAETNLAEVGTKSSDSNALAQATQMLNTVQESLDLLDSSSTEARAATILTGLGFSQEMMDGKYSALSGGWRSRCSLATSLLVQSDVLLLDECTNFLDLEATIWLEHFLADETRTLVVISHDQAFLTAVVEETIVLRNQTLKYFEGTPAAFEIEERNEAKRLMGQKEAMDKKREHVEKSIQQGIASAKKTGDENRQRMVKSRQKKLDDRWGVEQSASGHRFKLNRDLAGYHLTSRAEVTLQEQESAVKIKVPSPAPLRTLGNLISFEGIEYRFPRAKTPLLSDVTFTVEQGGRIAFVGANGNGKSTLAKLIVGKILPTKGKIVRHPQLKIGYFGQHSVEHLTLKTISNQGGPVTALSHFLEHFEEKGEKVIESEARACLGSFGLQGRIASDTPVSQLSGGQKVRLALAILVFHPPSLLLLDEVTTHLDFSTIKALSRALKTFEGGIVLITHDRCFSRVVVEKETFSHASGIEDEDEQEEEEDDSSDSDGEPNMVKKRGVTYRVGNGGIKVMEKGMSGYVGIVERKLARRRREEENAKR